MNAPFLQQHTKPIAEINIVPYVDVMLVLLVIFMITVPLLNEGVEVNLPQMRAKALPQSDVVPLVVSVSKEGELFLNIAENPKMPILPKILQIKVAASHRRDPKRAVIVRGDREVAYDKILDAMVLLQKAGIARVGLATKSIEDEIG